MWNTQSQKEKEEIGTRLVSLSGIYYTQTFAHNFTQAKFSLKSWLQVTIFNCLQECVGINNYPSLQG